MKWLATQWSMSVLHSGNQPRDIMTMTSSLRSLRFQWTSQLFAVCCSDKSWLVNQRGPRGCHSTSDTCSRTCFCSSAPPALPHSCYAHVFPVSVYRPGWTPPVRSSLCTLTREHSSLLYLTVCPHTYSLSLSHTPPLLIGGILTGV